MLARTANGFTGRLDFLGDEDGLLINHRPNDPAGGFAGVYGVVVERAGHRDIERATIFLTSGKWS